MGSELIYLENEFDNIALINPNKIVNELGFPEDRNIKQEDLVMYANLECNLQPRSRLLAGNDVQTLQTVAISSVNFLKPNGQNNLTTRWTEIQTEQDPNYINAELLGITNISYRVGPSQAATVDIQLEDVRGRALFESSENSIYSVFFNLPYPTFYLTLKGYMGKAVQYQLMLVKFQASMEPSSGNFLITLNFQSYKFNVLTDVQWAYALAVPNMYTLQSTQNLQTTSSNATSASVSQINSNNAPVNSTETSRGYKKMIQVYDEYKRKKLIPQNFPYLTIQQLIVRLENFEKNILDGIQKVSVEQLTDSQVFEDLLEEFLILVVNGNGTTSWKGEFTDPNKFYILKDGGGKVYPYIENFLEFQNAESKLSELINQYNTKLNSVNTFGNLSLNSSNRIPSNIKIESVVGSIRYIPDEQQIDIKQTARQRSTEQTDEAIAALELEITRELQALLKKQTDEENRRKQNNIQEYLTPVLFRFEGKGFFTDQLNELKQTLANKSKTIEENLTNEINTALQSAQGIGFEPTLRNVLAVIMASTDAFLRLMNDVHETAFANGTNAKKKNSVKEDVKSDPKSIVYPWPQYSKEVNVDGVVKFDIEYPGDPKFVEDSGASDYQAWPEVQFVEEFIKGYVRRDQIPLNPEPQSNAVTTIQRLCISAFDTPSNIVFSNYQEINFLFEIIERIEAIVRFQGYLQSPPKIENIFNLLMAYEASNVLISLGKENQNLNKILKDSRFNNYIEFLTFLKNASSNGIGNLWIKYISLVPTPDYLKNELINNSKILTEPLPDVAVSIVTETNPSEEENKMVEYLNSSSANNGPYSPFTIPFTQTYPFISESWNKLYLQDGKTNFSANKVLDTSKTLFYNTKVKKIVNYEGDYTKENEGKGTTVRPFNFFVNYSESIDFNQVHTNLDTFYVYREPKKSFYTEGQIFNGTKDANGNSIVKSTISTSSIMNMPFFIKSIQNGVAALKGGSLYPFLETSYFFLNSLPLTNLKGRYIDLDGQVRNYVGPSFKKIGAIHRIPKLFACKIGSVWYRYKIWKETGVDFLASSMGPLNQVESFDPVTLDPTLNYQFTGDDVPQDISLKELIVTEDGEEIESMNVGFYPTILNDFFYFLNGENLYTDTSTITNDIQLKINLQEVKIYSPSDSQINKFEGYDPTNPTRGISYKPISVLFKVKSQPITEGETYYFSAPSFGSRYTQVYSECFEGPTAVRNVFDNQYVYNGSVRFLWGGTHFGFAPTVNQICAPDEYMSFTQNNLWPWFLQQNSTGTNTTLDYIDDLFSVFTKEELDIFETEFKNFSRATNQCEDNFNIQSLLRFAVQVKQSDFEDSDKNNLIEKFQDKQLFNFNLVVGLYINKNLLYQKGNPSNYNPLNFLLFTNSSYYTNNPISEYKSQTPVPLPTQGYIKTWESSKLEYPEAWKALEVYVGFSKGTQFEYSGAYSFYTDFFPDLNVAFTKENVIRFAQEIKIYGSRKYLSFISGNLNNFDFRGEMSQYLELLAKTIDTIFSGVLTKIKKGLPTLAVQNNIEKNSATEGMLSKLQYYNLFKAINDKWVAGNNYNSETIFEDILLLDRAGRDIGDKIYIDVLAIKEQLKGADVASNIYSQVGGIIETNQFKIFSMPAYINFYGVQEIGGIKEEKLSHPFATDLFGTFTEVDYQKTKSKLVCVYTELPSEQTENPAITNGFTDDSFNLGVGTKNPNVEGRNVKDAKDDYAISNKCVGFAVDFGLQNQGVFSKINVSQDVGKATAESLARQYELANLYNGTKSATQSVSLYNIYTTRSYGATITAMGNAMIQPTMYFVLRNVPLFAGPYYIDSVQHQITNGNFTTTFTGTRQKLYTPPLENALLESIKKTFLSKLVNNLVTKRQTEKRIEQNTIQTKNSISNQINSTFAPSSNPICKPTSPYTTYSASTPTAASESIESMWKKIDSKVTAAPGFSGTGIDYVVFTLFYVNSFDGSKFKYYNNNVSQIPIGPGTPVWGGSLSQYFDKNYICMNGQDNLSQAYVTFPSVDNCINFNLLRYEKVFAEVVKTTEDENQFVSGFTKTWIQYVPYDKTPGTDNLYENFVETNKSEFDRLTEKVRKSYKIVRSYKT